MTDHQALKTIYGPKSKPSARIERWVFATFQLQSSLCGLSEEHCGRPVSANLNPCFKGVQDEEYLREVNLQAVQVALRIEEIEVVLYQDEELTAEREALKTGNWRQAPKAYEMICNELTYIVQVVLRGTRILVPKKLQRRTLDSAHEGHRGIVKTKESLRSKVWWPGIDKDAGRKCRECFGCQLISKHDPPPPVKPTRLPERAWQEVTAD